VSGRSVVGAQGLYYVATGAWSVVHRDSFEAVSGRKTDYWLVRTVGLLAAAIGATLLLAARRERVTAEAAALAVAAGTSFAAIDVVYVARRRISPVYLADAALHGVLAALAVSNRRRPSAP
jgi:hypothetical protein